MRAGGWKNFQKLISDGGGTAIRHLRVVIVYRVVTDGTENQRDSNSCYMF